MACWRLLLTVVVLAYAASGALSINSTMIEEALAQLTSEDKALYIADFLINRGVWFEQLQRILVASADMSYVLTKSPGDVLAAALFDQLPWMLKNPTFQRTVAIMDEGFSQVNVSDIHRCEHSPPDLKQVAMAYLSRADYWTMARRILTEAICPSVMGNNTQT